MPAERSITTVVREVREGHALSSAANDFDKLAAEVEKTEHKFQLFQKDAARVNAEISKSTARVKELQTQIARTGDRGLFGDLRKEEANLRRFQNLAKNLQKDFASTFGAASGIIKGPTVDFAPASAAAVGAIAAAAAAAAPVLGAMISGVVVGAVGTGGIIGGVLAASHDPGVQAAFETFAKSAEGTFFNAGQSFVAPLEQALPDLARTFKGLGLDKTFAAAAPDLMIIVGGLEKLAENVMPGLNKLLDRSGPFAQAAAQGFADFGTSLSRFFDDISASHGSVEGLTLAFNLLNNTIILTGKTLGFLSSSLHAFNEGNARFLGDIDQTLASMEHRVPAIHDAATRFKLLAGDLELVSPADVGVIGGFVGAVTSLGNSAALTDKQIAALNKETEEFNKLVEDLIGNSLSVDEAQTQLRKSFRDLADTLQQNGNAWGTNTDAAFANEEAVQRLIEQADRLRQAEIKSGDVSASVANNEYEQNIRQLLAMAEQAGLTKDALDALAKKYLIEFDIASNLQAIGQAIGAQFAGFNGVGGGLASGGPALPGMTYTVGENGPERLDVLPGGGAIVTPMGGRAGQTVNVTIVLPGGGDLGSAVVAHLAKHAQIYGGGNVQLAITGRSA